ncbi:MAG: flagellar filament outer layer protein FlaA [Spirochaetaceae bacterium]|nr:flagellar filament outer layer protein FlaA [Spirochaetaceae bacterium]
MMKRGSLFILGLILLIILPVGSAFGDERTLKLESRVIESFDAPGDITYEDGTSVYWQVRGSKFSMEGYPRMAYAPETWPIDLFGKNPENRESLQTFGINGKFLRQGYNTIEVIPGQGEGDDWVEKPIPLPGRIKMFDFWVWGSNYNYSIEAHFMDYRGITHRFEMVPAVEGRRYSGSINFSGWRNMYIDIPNYVKQAQSHKPNYEGLSLTKIVIRTHPEEAVDNFYVYLDNLKVLTDFHESFYDGFELSAEEKIAEIWGTEGGTE